MGCGGGADSPRVAWWLRACVYPRLSPPIITYRLDHSRSVRVSVPGGGANSRTKAQYRAWPSVCLARLSAPRRCAITCDRTRDKNATDRHRKDDPITPDCDRREHWAVRRKRRCERRRRSICPILCTRTTGPARSMNHRRRSFIYLYVVCHSRGLAANPPCGGAGHARLRLRERAIVSPRYSPGVCDTRPLTCYPARSK